MTTTPAARDERLEFLKRFDLDGRFKYDENTHQFIQLTDQPEHFAMLERITACYCGWLERDTLAESELAEVRERNAQLEKNLDTANKVMAHQRARRRYWIGECGKADIATRAAEDERDELRAELERVKQFLADDGRPAFEAMCAEQSRNITRCDIEGLEWGYMNTLTHDRWCGFYSACIRLAAIGAGEGEAR